MVINLSTGKLFLFIFVINTRGTSSGKQGFKTIENNIEDDNAPNNPGLPLGPKDFFLASQLPIMPSNITSELMMKPPKYYEKRLEELEAKGDHLHKSTKNGLSKLGYHWPNGVVPYVIDAAFSTSERAIIAQGIQHIHDHSCVRFEARNGESDYLDIGPGGGGCYAIIPYRTGGGKHTVGLEQPGCVTMKIVVHELLHSLGVKHEQCRPDRDSYISMDWTNIQAGGAGQFFIDTWKGQTATLPECDETNVAGADYSNCVSSWQVDACGVLGDTDHQGYDFTSIMHYRLNSFAIDSNQNVMNPIDPTVTSAGNTELSTMDKAKLQCMYNCDGTTYSGCGGHQSGASGALDALDDDSCEWLIVVADGFAIELTVSQFDVDCSNKLQIYDGEDDSEPLTEYCNGSPATLVTSSDSKLYITWTKTGAGNKFSATWTIVPIVCCQTVRLESSETIASMYHWLIPGTYTYSSGDDINDRGIYRNGDYWIAVKTVADGWIPSWVISNGDPGQSSGWMFGKSSAPKCPHAVGSWDFFSQTSGAIESDPTLKVVCDVSCTQDPPTAPADSSTNWDGSSKTVGTIVTYSCTTGEKKYAECKADGLWNPSSITACSVGGTTSAPTPPPVTTAPPPVTTAPPPTTAPPSCSTTFTENTQIKGKKVKGKIAKTDTIEECWEKCEADDSCNYINWIQEHKKPKKEKKCFLLKTNKKTKTKNGYTSGGCTTKITEKGC